MNNILDSADNPLTGKKFWLKSSDPFQCLATFHEIAAAYKRKKPERHMSSLPIFQHDPTLKTQHIKALEGGLESVRYIPTFAMVPNIRNRCTDTEFYNPALSFHMSRVIVSFHREKIPILFKDDFYATRACDIEHLKGILGDEFYNTYTCSSLTKNKLLEEYENEFGYDDGDDDDDELYASVVS
jgi:DNA-directed RNA polymerase